MLTKLGPVAISALAPDRLNSWKEIASYLGRDPRTVQLWEKHEGLPVHRHNHQSRASVYAYAAEIDLWLKARSARAGPVDIAQASAWSTGSRNRSRHSWVLVVLVLVATVAMVIAWWAWHQKNQMPRASLPSIVVIPFEDQSSSGDGVSGALTREITKRLESDKGVLVVPSSPNEEFRQLSARRIQSRYHAAYALRGTIAELGDEAAVTVELLDAKGDKYLWNTTLIRKASEIRSGYDRVGAEIAETVLQRMGREVLRLPVSSKPSPVP